MAKKTVKKEDEPVANYGDRKRRCLQKMTVRRREEREGRVYEVPQVVSEIDIDRETLISLTDLAKAIGVTRSAVYAWTRYGRIGRMGQAVMLEVVIMPNQLFTSHEAYSRFLRRLNE